MERELIDFGKWKVWRHEGNTFRVILCMTDDIAFAVMGKVLLDLDGKTWIETPDGEKMMQVKSCHEC